MARRAVNRNDIIGNDDEQKTGRRHRCRRHACRAARRRRRRHASGQRPAGAAEDREGRQEGLCRIGAEADRRRKRRSSGRSTTRTRPTSTWPTASRNRALEGLIARDKPMSDLYAKQLANELIAADETEVRARRKMQNKLMRALAAQEGRALSAGRSADPRHPALQHRRSVSAGALTARLPSGSCVMLPCPWRTRSGPAPPAAAPVRPFGHRPAFV